jgi:hypothetical protein
MPVSYQPVFGKQPTAQRQSLKLISFFAATRPLAAEKKKRDIFLYERGALVGDARR